MPEAKFRYDFPAGNSDPFDREAAENYFAFANAFSNLGKDLAEFAIPVLERNIPMGYKTIILCRRIACFGGGIPEKIWEPDSISLKPGTKNYFLTSDRPVMFHHKDWNRDMETHVIHQPEAGDASLASGTWENLGEAIAHARKLAEEQDLQILVSLVIDSLSWH